MAKRLSTPQTTLRDRVVVSGIGVHSGKAVSMTMGPAEADSGIVFQRIDDKGHHGAPVRVSIDSLSATDSCTTIGMNGSSVATIEHLLATFNGLGVDNVAIEIDGAEVPMMDGSASAFVDRVDEAQLIKLDQPRRFIKVLKPVRIEHGTAFAELLPHDGRRFEIDIDFASPLIGRQAFVFDLAPQVFRRDLAARPHLPASCVMSRPTGRAAWRSAPRSRTPSCSATDKILNPEGLRYADEFVRHKALDAVGDLALAGAPILGAYRSYRGGHRMNAAIVAAASR